jgi:LuxR family maltose regulon positive regulatory protein
MFSDLLATKLHIPPSRPENVARPRLTSVMDQVLTHRLSLISAPAGFGKTTLLSGWLAGLDQPHAWLTLDEQDNDPSRFAAYLIAALQGIDRRIGQQIEGVIQSPQTLPLASVLTALINGMGDLATDIVLVLDDYHLLRASECHRAIDLLLKYSPSKMHLVIATRTKPPLSLARLRVEGQLIELGTEDLRFIQPETDRFLKMATGSRLSAQIIAVLQQRTEGWIAGLQLAALSLRGRDVDATRRFITAFGGSHRHVVDYLTDEVMAQQSAALREFMSHTALLDRLTGDLCDHVTGQDDSSAILGQLEKENLFLIPLDDEGIWYRYHHLFASYLRTELNERQRQTVHHRAAQWYEEHGYLNEAIEHLLASGEPDRAAALIERTGYTVFQRGGLVTLSRWLERLPEETILERMPLLSFRALTSFILTQSTDAERYLQVLEQKLPPDAPAAARGRLLGMKAWVASRKGDLDGAIALGDQATRLLADQDSFANSFVLVTVGQAHEAQGDTLAAAAVYRQASALAKQARAPFAVMLALVNLALSLDSLGRRREGLALCEQTLRGRDQRRGLLFPLADVMQLPQGVFYYRANDLARAEDLIRQGVDACARYGLGSNVLLGRYYLGRVLLAIGNVEAALDITEKESPQTAVMEQDHYFVGLYGSLQALIALKQGDIDAATSWAESLNPPDNTTAPYWFDHALLTFVGIRLYQHKYDEARRALDDLEGRLVNASKWGTLIPVYLQRAALETALGNENNAAPILEKAVRLAAEEGYVQPFVDDGPRILKRLPPMRHIAPSFVDKVLAGVRASETRRSQRALVDPLTAREREVLQLVAQDLTNQEIAERLVIVVSTVKKHINRIFSKLDARDRTQAVLKARELDLV